MFLFVNSANTTWNSKFDATYDAASELRLASTKDANGVNVTGQQYDYTYDAAGNMINRATGTASTAFPVNPLNQTSNGSSGGSTLFDVKGNLTSQIFSGTQTLFYTYDAANELTSVATDTYYTPEASRWKVEFVYDGLLRLRIRREYIHTVGLWYVSTETRYLYDGMLMLSERTSSGTPTATYVRGSDLSGSRSRAGGIGGLLARSTGYSAGTWTTHDFYHADGIGNITALLGAGQVLSANYRYDPFGGLLASSGTQAAANPMRFSSKPVLVDKPAQLGTIYYYGYRFYDPALHRWLNRDPNMEGADFSLHRFCHNLPTTEIDPVGLNSFFCNKNSALRGKGHNAYAAGDETDGYEFRSFSTGDSKTSEKDNMEERHFKTLKGLETFLEGNGFSGYLQYDTDSDAEAKALKYLKDNYNNTRYELGGHDCNKSVMGALQAAGVETVCGGTGAAIPDKFFDQNKNTGTGRSKTLNPKPPLLKVPSRLCLSSP